MTHGRIPFEGICESVDFYFSGPLGSPGLDVLIHLIEGGDPCHRLWLEAIHPVEELHKCFQSSLLATLHGFHHIRARVRQMSHDEIVEEEHWRAFERPWDIFLIAVQNGGTLSISDHECSVIDQSFGEDGEQNGPCVVPPVIVQEDEVHEEDSTNKLDMLLNKSYKTIFVGLVSLNIVGDGQPRRVEDMNLTKRSCLLFSLKPWCLPMCHWRL